MDYFKKTGAFIGLILLVITTSQCASSKKIKTKLPLELGQVYYQWTPDNEGGNSKKSLYIPVISNENAISLDSVYFQGQVAKLERINNSLFIGNFKTTAIEKPDLIMSSDPHEEYGNIFQKPKQADDIPFDLNNTQCVISYKEGNKTSYFTIEGVIKK
ncbi:hypothetical protein [Yeosuana marina]|uniref:hypothetical protein n=1 Tax=Yeosuana marina TaxID=1565536 RepID=UPI0030ED56ED|tara:strand:- start:5569 stop:6042 length:474 start_codon:yes stop_codon:yes gene_type:complete